MALELKLDLSLSNNPLTREFVLNYYNTSDITIDWGDGSTPTILTPVHSSISHMYGDSPISYDVTVSISGDTDSCLYIHLTNVGNEMVTDCTDFGDITNNIEFYNAINLISVPNILPSNMTSLSYMFYGATAFDQNINGWDVNNVTLMNNMFHGATSFNQPLNGWDVSNVTDMSEMFSGAKSFNQNIGGWVTSAVTKTRGMFENASSFNQPLNGWDVSNVTEMQSMFSGAKPFNQNIGSWVTSAVTNMNHMFYGTTAFDQNINGWNVGNVADMEGLFFNATAYNQPLNDWDVSNVENMKNMFNGAIVFDENLQGWVTSAVTTMYHMFYRAYVFDQDIGGWDVSKVNNMERMFHSANMFNQDIGGWVTSAVTTMAGMFEFAKYFDQDIGNWDVSNVTTMQDMFYGTSAFNQDIGDWVTSAATTMESMFRGAKSFDQDISDWDITNVTTMENMFLDAHTIQRQYYDDMLTKWGQQDVQFGVLFHAGVDTQYTCDSIAEDYRNNTLIGPNGWHIIDGGCYSSIMDYYVDISSSYIVTGDGTQESPFNRSQLDDIISDDNRLENGLTFHIRGQLELKPNSSTKFLSTLSTGSTPKHITLRGWDITNRGCPIIMWNNPTELNAGNLTGNAWWFSTWTGKTSVTIQDFIVTCPYSFYDFHAVGDEGSLTYKNVHFVVHSYNNWQLGGSVYEHRNYYGCTFNCDEMYLRNVDEMLMSDCVIDTQNISIDSLFVLKMYNNVTNVPDFISNISNVSDISGYTTPIFNNNIISTPAIADLASFTDYYTDNNLMYYKRYNIATSNNTSLETYRNDNGYNNGLFNEPRLSYGAYSFFGSVDDIPEDFSTSGVIGSFYLGPNYDNGYAFGDLSIHLEPTLGVNIDGISRDIDVPSINITVPSGRDRKEPYVYTQDRFLIDFVHKKRSDDTYPKFCGLIGSQVSVCDNCKTSEDVKEYNARVYGGNSLIVDFLACAKGVGEFENYKPVAYHWYFDYENRPGWIVTCAGPYATNTYCGTYLDEYDVRLCVDFEIGGL